MGADAEVVQQVGGLVRRVRRDLDLSQRDLAAKVGTSSSTIARAESHGRVSVDLLCRVLALAGYRLSAVTELGGRVEPMRADTLRNRGGRRYPAHLDAQFPLFKTPDVAAWMLRHRRHRGEPFLTFHRRRERDAQRRRAAAGDRMDRSQFPPGSGFTSADDHPSRREYAYWRNPGWAAQDAYLAQSRAVSLRRAGWSVRPELMERRC